MLTLRHILFTSTLVFCSLSSLSQLTPTHDDIWIPMSDGDSLQADVYLPAGASQFEAILIQTPYNKNNFGWSLPMGIGQNLDDQPFAFVIVDWRGFYGSANADLTSIDRGQDAYDVCDWIVAQPWHLSRIGTWGPSALGGIQYQLISKQHPNHTCAVPLVAVGQTSYDHYFYGGVLEEARLEQLDALGYGLTPTIMANTYYSSTWQYIESTTYAAPDIIIPTLQIGGWYDHNIDDMMDFYEASRTETVISIQDEQWLLVGPWVHGGTGAAYVGSAIQGELTYSNAAFKSDLMAWAFFEYYLLDSANNWENTPKVTYYEMGGNDTWHTTNDANIEGSNDEILYLNSQWRLTPENGNGTSTYTVDPNDPSPTIGGATLHADLEQGPYDQTYLDGRTDIYTFSSDTLTEEVSITGRIWLDLYVSADQPDCDISIRLVDVYPDGTNMLITDGIKRMRFREGYTLAAEQLMTPGEIYNVQIKLPFTNYTWLPDHQIKIYVGGNHSTRFNVNLQNGGPMYAPGVANLANITLHHDELYPSKIVLPSDNSWLAAEEEEVTEDFSVYPNPANSQLTIKANKQFASYAIFDISGRQVAGDQLIGKTIDVTDLTEGVYILKLTDEEGNVAEEKFLKQ
jgi:uncharacterized protein